MPIEFISRLVVVRVGGEKFRVQYGYLGDPCHGIFQFRGPKMVLPPEQELTEQELENWTHSILSTTGFSMMMERLAVDAPLLTATRTIEDKIPRGCVESTLKWEQFPQLGEEMTLCVEVVNRSHQPIPNFSMFAVHNFESPMKGHGIVGEITGAFEKFVALEPLDGEYLYQDKPRLFGLPDRFLDQIKSRALMMSPESHYISLKTDSKEFDRISGQEVATFLMKEIE